MFPEPAPIQNLIILCPIKDNEGGWGCRSGDWNRRSGGIKSGCHGNSASTCLPLSNLSIIQILGGARMAHGFLSSSCAFTHFLFHFFPPLIVDSAIGNDDCDYIIGPLLTCASVTCHLMLSPQIHCLSHANYRPTAWALRWIFAIMIFPGISTEMCTYVHSHRWSFFPWMLWTQRQNIDETHLHTLSNGNALLQKSGSVCHKQKLFLSWCVSAHSTDWQWQLSAVWATLPKVAGSQPTAAMFR